jgi:hypothetical protein
MNEKTNQSSPNTEDEQTASNKPPNFLQIVGSVLAAGFGVQSRKNRERDFKQGNLKTFVIAGIIFTVLFIFTLYSVVSLILK